MKNRLALIFFVIILLFFPACGKKEIRLDNFLVEFATVIKKDSSLTFQLDNNTVLTPQSPPTIKLENGNRVIINYIPLEKGVIKLNSVRPIFLDTIKEEGYPDKVKTSPIKIISVWVSGKYLNMSFHVDYHSKPHITGLFKDTEAAKPTLYFSYSRGEDPPGAPTLTYLSFNLESLKEKEFTIHINTYDGFREFLLKRN
jgi:hypothetical protein